MNLTHEYTPRGACREVFSHREPEVLIAGPAGTGKSRACLEKMHAMALANPGFRGLMVRKTHRSLTASGLETWRREVAAESIRARAIRYYGGSGEKPAQYTFQNGSAVLMGGMDNPEKVLSTQYDLIYVQEATELTEDDWETLSTRLRGGEDVAAPFRQILADCNPSQETHWLKMRCDRGQTLMLRSNHRDNPLLVDEDGHETPEGKDYLDRLRNLTGVRYLRLYKGEWSSAEGVVYEDWDSSVHLIDPFDIPVGWPVYLSVDFGYTNPFVCQWWARDPDGRLYLFKELYKTKRLVSEHAEVIKQESRPFEKQIKAIVCDHDAEGRAQLAKALGMRTTGARKAVQEGIQAVQTRLKIQDDGKPRLFIMHDATLQRDPELVEVSRPTSTADEITGYVWDQKPDKPPKEEPVKEDDHGMDAMRYMVMHLDRKRRSLAGVDLTGGLGI